MPSVHLVPREASEAAICFSRPSRQERAAHDLRREVKWRAAGVRCRDEMEECSPRRATDPWVFELVLELLLWPALVAFAAFYAFMEGHIGDHAQLLIVGGCVFLGAFWIATIILPTRRSLT